MGRLIVIEGIDGSGKGTQTKLLIERLRKDGFKVGELDFPRYDKDSSLFVRKYLNGEYGELTSEQASLLYALDRFDAMKDIEEKLSENDFVISNRYTTSNMVHQGGKALQQANHAFDYVANGAFNDIIEFIKDIEYNKMKIAKPDKVFFLNVGEETAKVLIEKKEQRNYIKEGNKDIHEKDDSHLKFAFRAGLKLCNKGEFEEVDCYDGQPSPSLMNIEEINDKLYKEIFHGHSRFLKKKSKA